MINSVSGSISSQTNFASQSTGGTSKVKLDLNSVPESKVKIQTSSPAGEGKGVRIDIKA